MDDFIKDTIARHIDSFFKDFPTDLFGYKTPNRNGGRSSSGKANMYKNLNCHGSQGDIKKKKKNYENLEKEKPAEN